MATAPRWLVGNHTGAIIYRYFIFFNMFFSFFLSTGRCRLQGLIRRRFRKRGEHVLVFAFYLSYLPPSKNNLSFSRSTETTIDFTTGTLGWSTWGTMIFYLTRAGRIQHVKERKKWWFFSNFIRLSHRALLSPEAAANVFVHELGHRFSTSLNNSF